MPRLILPSPKYKKNFLKYQGNSYAHTYQAFGLTPKNITKKFPLLLQLWGQHRKGWNLPKEWVPYTMYWLVDGDKYVGQASVRHKLDKNLKKVGGHIGYEIIEPERRKGYGKLLLKLALKKAKHLGIKKVLVTCSEDNIGSRKIIEANGGRFASRFWSAELKVYKLRYWIAI